MKDTLETVESFASASSLGQTTRQMYALLRESHDRLVAAVHLAEVGHVRRAAESDHVPADVRVKLGELVAELSDLENSAFGIRKACEAVDEADQLLDELASEAREELETLARASHA